MNCPVCSSNKNHKIFTASNFHGRHQISSQKIIFLKCIKCSCLFLRIKIDKNFYKKYYPNDYQTPAENEFLTKVWQSFNYRYKNQLISDNSTLLDVGCGQGDFIRQLPNTIIGSGIDLIPKIAKNIIKDNFLTHKFSQKFDTITFWHSLEHFSNPRQVIRKSLSLLNEHGQILISIPNTNSLAFKLGQNNWFHLDSPRHLFLPNNKNIQHLFPKNNEIKIHYFPFEFPLDLFWSLKKFPCLRILYPLLKIFDHETMTVIYQKN